MTRSICVAALLLVSSGCGGDTKDSAPADTSAGTTGTADTQDTADTDDPDIPEGTLDEVLPIVADHCLECHSAAAATADLDLETDFCGTVLDGRLVIPGSTGESLLYRRITSADSPMPPAGLLDTDTIRPIGVWILNGASCE